MRILKFFIPILFIWAVIFSGCRKDRFETDSSSKLEFSTDTLTFDTVFTTLGSATRLFKVYNKHKHTINITSVKLAGGVQSNFRINVDAVPGTTFKDVEVLGNDSIYVFVEVTVDPNKLNTPLVIFDQVVFITNGNLQQVVLEAWGQDAHFFKDSIVCDQVWENDKPYVVMNSMAIDSGCTLTINPGVQIYFGGRSSLFVQGTSQLFVHGTLEEPVLFRGVRLETFYEDLPGQWGGIFILRGSYGNTINYAIIENSDFGISAGSAPLQNAADFPNVFRGDNAPEVLMQNTIIRNVLANAIWGFLSVIVAENCLAYNGGDHLVSLTFGGRYDFNHCTFANYGSATINHQASTLLLGNAVVVNNAAYLAAMDATFENTIVYGSLENETVFAKQPDAPFDVTFDHCLLKTKANINLTDTATYINAIKNQDPLFTDRSKDDYTITANSPAVNAGKLTMNSQDLAGQARDGQRDIGAYELND